MARLRSACAILGVASGALVVDAFLLPLASSPAIVPGAPSNRRPLPLSAAAGVAPYTKSTLSLSNSGGDTDLAEGVESLDADLSQEIEDALSLAQDALAAPVDEGPDEEDIDEIASMLLERPPIAPPPLPVPPSEEPPAALVVQTLEGAVDEEVGPSPPDEAPPDLGESLRQKVAEEVEKLTATLFGLKEELGKAEVGAVEVEDAAAALKKEIEESLRKREELMAQIEKEAA